MKKNLLYFISLFLIMAVLSFAFGAIAHDIIREKKDLKIYGELPFNVNKPFDTISHCFNAKYQHKTIFTQETNKWAIDGEGCSSGRKKQSFVDWFKEINWQEKSAVKTDKQIDSLAQFSIGKQDYMTMTQADNVWFFSYSQEDNKWKCDEKKSFENWFKKINWQGKKPVRADQSVDAIAQIWVEEENKYFTTITQGDSVWILSQKSRNDEAVLVKKEIFKDWAREFDWKKAKRFNTKKPIDSLSHFMLDGKYHTWLIQGNYIWLMRDKSFFGKAKVVYRWKLKYWGQRTQWEETK